MTNWEQCLASFQDCNCGALFFCSLNWLPENCYDHGLPFNSIGTYALWTWIPSLLSFAELSQEGKSWTLTLHDVQRRTFPSSSFCWGWHFPMVPLQANLISIPLQGLLLLPVTLSMISWVVQKHTMIERNKTSVCIQFVSVLDIF